MERLRLEQCKNCNDYNGCMTHCFNICGKPLDALEEFNKYKDLEERGKLLKLPCAVGDTVYKIWSCGKNGKTIAEFVVSHIDIDYLPDIEFSYRKENGHGNYYFSKIEDIGKTVFLTRQEAERALAEMEGNK